MSVAGRVQAVCFLKAVYAVSLFLGNNASSGVRSRERADAYFKVSVIHTQVLSGRGWYQAMSCKGHGGEGGRAQKSDEGELGHGAFTRPKSRESRGRELD